MYEYNNEKNKKIAFAYCKMQPFFSNGIRISIQIHHNIKLAIFDSMFSKAALCAILNCHAKINAERDNKVITNLDKKRDLKL